MSLGSTEDSELLDDVMEEVGEDAVVVASAGNGGSQETQDPAATGGVVSVASVDSADELSVFSNHGWVDVAAPGEEIVSTFPGGGFAGWSGTSMATPLVPGQAAVLLALLGEDSVDQVPTVITSTAVAGDPSIGADRIDVAASVEGARSSTTDG